MRVGLHDADGGTYPNLALMKLSAWHKAAGDAVEWFMPLMDYDKVFSSKVFTFTKENPYLPSSTIKGGTGYGMKGNLPDCIEHIMPDYALYPDCRVSMGFTTRGCIRCCPWCVVPRKEGKIRAHAEIAEFLRPDSRDVVLMDNNILAHSHGISQIEWARKKKLRLDCNQGLDARIIASDKVLAKLLGDTLWIKQIRLACDTQEMMPVVDKAVMNIRSCGKKHDIMSYVLVKSIESALPIVEFLRGIDVKPFAQPYRDFTSNKEPEKSLKKFARWVNYRPAFYSVPWEKYKYREAR